MPQPARTDTKTELSCFPTMWNQKTRREQEELSFLRVISNHFIQTDNGEGCYLYLALSITDTKTSFVYFQFNSSTIFSSSFWANHSEFFWQHNVFCLPNEMLSKILVHFWTCVFPGVHLEEVEFVQTGGKGFSNSVQCGYVVSQANPNLFTRNEPWASPSIILFYLV